MGLGLVEMVIAFEQHFGVSISDAVAERLLTPRDVIEHLTPRLDPSEWTRERIAHDVLEIVRDELGVDHVKETDRFIEDLQAD